MTNVEAFTLGVARFCKVADIDADDRRALASLLLMPAADATVIIDGIGKQAATEQEALKEYYSPEAVASRTKAFEHGNVDADEAFEQGNVAAEAAAPTAAAPTTATLATPGSSEEGWQKHWYQQSPEAQKLFADWKESQGGGVGGGATAAAAPAAAPAATTPTTGSGGGGGAEAAANIAGSTVARAGGAAGAERTPTPAELAAERAGVLGEANKGFAHLADVGTTAEAAEKQYEAMQTMTGQRRSIRRQLNAMNLNLTPDVLSRLTPEQIGALTADKAPEVRNAINTAVAQAKRTTWDYSHLKPQVAAQSAPAASADVTAPEAAAHSDEWKWQGSSPPTEEQNKMLTRGNPAGIDSALRGAEQTARELDWKSWSPPAGANGPGVGGPAGPTLARHGRGSTTSLGLTGGLTGPEYAAKLRGSKAGLSSSYEPRGLGSPELLPNAQDKPLVSKQRVAGAV